jgi:phosphonate transport system permease protein
MASLSNSSDSSRTQPRYSSMVKTSMMFVGIALVSLYLADISVTTHDPWLEMTRLLVGIFSPKFIAIDIIANALIQTVAFALIGVSLGAVVGFMLAQVFHLRTVRVTCAFLRAIHELFWALIFLQMLGLTPLTGILAIALPYSGICAKVYAETLEEAETPALKTIPFGSKLIPTFFYVRLPEVWVHILNYTRYRFECGLRSSAVLGFV